MVRPASLRMADLRIVDAPVLSQESITDDVKMPTGGLGNFSIRLGDIVWYVAAKENLASKGYVDLSSKGVKDSLDEHISDKNNPHNVTKAQVGLGNVDNTADIDKPVSNAVKSNLLSKADKIDTYTKIETDNKISTLSSTTYAGHKGYATLADAQAAQASLPTNTIVEVTNDGDTSKNGVYLWNGTTLTKSTYDALGQAKAYTDTLVNSYEVNRAQNSNKVTLDQVLFKTMPTATTGTATVVNRNGIKQLKLVSASVGGHIIAYWDFDASLFTREFAGSLTIEGADAGSNGYVGIQQIASNGTILATSYAQTAIVDAITKKVFRMTSTGVVSGAVKIRLIAFLQTTTTRQMHVHSPFIADGTNTEFIAPEKTINLQPIEVQLNQVGAKVSLIGEAFEYKEQKNMFNPALSTDGKIISYADGTLATFANGIAFSKVPVQKGKTYTFWIPGNSSFYFRDLIYTFAADGSYLGLDKSAGSAYEKINPTPPSGVSYSDGKRTVTFTIPSNSQIAYVQMMAEYSTHTTAQFDALVNSMQFELGGVKTAFEAYNPNAIPKLVLKESALPTTQPTTQPSVATTGNTFAVTLDGTDAYIRTKFSDTLDLVQQVRYGTNNVWSNNVINPWSVKTIPNTTAKDGVIAAFSSGTILASQGDDAAPLNYNGTYIGANHGAYIAHQVTASGHGKTYADVGSQWTANSLTYTIVRIVDANTLWLVSQNIGTTTWQFNITSLSGQTLTHSTGATNTASIAVTADTITQLLSAVNNHTKKIIADGYRELSASGVYDVEFVEFVDNYDIMQPTAILSYLQSKVGTTTEQKLNVDSIASDVRVSATYRIALNGSMTVNTQLYKKGNINFSFAGLVQANPPNYGGKKLIEYAPKMKPVTVSGAAYDLTATIDATSNTALINLLKSDWLDATNPPDRMLQLVRNGTTNEFGHVLGYSLVRGDTKSSIRQNTTDAGFFNNPSTKKMYPKALVTNLDTVVNAVAYRSVFNSAVLPQATVFTWYQDNNDIYVVLDMHQNASYLKLPLPTLFNGKSAAVVDSNANFTLHSDIVSDGGLLVSVTNNYGQATIKLS